MATVRPISPQYQHTLDSAISLAKELASKNMADSGESSPKTPNSPDKKRFNFSKLKHFRESFSEASANIRDIESSISYEAKQAYKSLVERGPYNSCASHPTSHLRHHTLGSHTHHNATTAAAHYANDDFSPSFSSSSKIKHGNRLINLINIMHCNTIRSISFAIQVESPLASSFRIFNKNPFHTIGDRPFHSVQDDKHSWSVLEDLYTNDTKRLRKGSACLLLNLTDSSFKHFERFKYIWDAANLSVAVDGSANTLARKKLIHTADVVCGDFDSVDDKLIRQLRNPSKDIRSILPSLYASGPLPRLPTIIETPDQRQTDFTKAIHVATSIIPKLEYFFGLYQSNGTRIDHLFALINTLHLIKKNIILVNIKSNTISWLLAPGSHIILKPKGRELCSLVPFTGPSKINEETRTTWLQKVEQAIPISLVATLADENSPDDLVKKEIKIIGTGQDGSTILDAIILPKTVFTKRSQKFGQWIDHTGTVYGLGFNSEVELNEFVETFGQLQKERLSQSSNHQQPQLNHSSSSNSNFQPQLGLQSDRSTRNQQFSNDTSETNGRYQPNKNNFNTTQQYSNTLAHPGHQLKRQQQEQSLNDTINVDNGNNGSTTNNNGVESASSGYQRSQSMLGLQSKANNNAANRRLTPDEKNSPLSRNESQLKYENERLKEALEESAKNAGSWHNELQNLRTNNAKLTQALQESKAHVKEWEHELLSLRDENNDLKLRLFNLDSANDTEKRNESLNSSQFHLQSQFKQTLETIVSKLDSKVKGFVDLQKEIESIIENV